jgi:hypothetical protein
VTTEPSVSPTDLGDLVITAAKFLSGCSGMAQFKGNLSFVEWISLSLLYKEPMTAKMIRRSTGMSATRVRECLRSLESRGFASLADQKWSITDKGVTEFEGLNRALIPILASDKRINVKRVSQSTKNLRLLFPIYAPPAIKKSSQ